MTSKDVTRQAALTTIDFMFTGVRDMEHALFIMEVMDEYPTDQVVKAIDIDGAVPHWMFAEYTFAAFIDSMQVRIELVGKEIELNMLANSLAGA